MARKILSDGRWCWMNDDGSIGPPCPEPTDKELEHFQACEKYQRQADETGKEVWWRGEKFTPAGGVRIQDAPPRKPGTKEYKVITQRDEFFKSAFNPEALESLLNTYAEDGWRVVSMTATDVGSFWGSFWDKGGGAARQELIVLLERAV